MPNLSSGGRIRAPWAHVQERKNGANGRKQKKRNDISRYNWREKVGDWWGITGGDVNKTVDGALEEICDSLNRPTFNYEREADTVTENDEAVIDDDVTPVGPGPVKRLWRRIPKLRG